MKTITQGLQYGGSGAALGAPARCHLLPLPQRPAVSHPLAPAPRAADACNPTARCYAHCAALPGPAAADPKNQKTMAKTKQDSKAPWSYDYHTFAVDWAPYKIVSEYGRWAGQGCGQDGQGFEDRLRGLEAMHLELAGATHAAPLVPAVLVGVVRLPPTLPPAPAPAAPSSTARLQRPSTACRAARSSRAA